MPLSFLVPAFLVGLAALAIPILIHLSRRQTKEPVQFPSLMFLKRIPQETEQRRRIHRWPLLLLRALALALLVFAFSRPFLERDDAAAAASTGSREVVVLLDRSYSMGLGDRWQRAVDAGLEAIGTLSGTDRGTVILFDSGAESATESTVDQSVLQNAIEDAEPGPFATRYAPALRYGARLLSSSPLPRHELVVISDFQAAGWDVDGGDVSTIRLPPGTEITPISVADSARTYNVTLADADLQRSAAAGRDRLTVTAQLIGVGEVPGAVPVTLEIDGRVVETRQASFDEGDIARVEFSPVTLPQSGASRGTLRTPDEDDLTADNALNFVLSSDQRMGVLIIEGVGSGDQSSFFLERALSIGEEPGFRVDTRRSNQVSTLDLSSNAVVILNQTAIPGGETGRRLRQFVEQGGGLIFLLGNNPLGEWSDVLPSVPQAVDRSAAGGTTIGYVDTGHPVFEAFAGPRTGDFASARFYRYRPLPANAFPRVLARFGDGGVALAETPVDEGRVLVWSSTLDGSWNDLALQPVFLPFLHQLVRYSAGYTPPRNWLTVGEPLDPGAIAQGGETFQLALTPSAQRVNLSGQTAFRLGEVGFYELRRSEDDQQSVTFASNVDPGEAVQASFDPEEMRTALLATASNSGERPIDAELTLAERERQQSGWWYLVVLAFALFAAETLLSNRARRTSFGAFSNRSGKGMSS